MALLKQYKDHPQVKKAVAHLSTGVKNPAQPTDSTGRYLNQIGGYELLLPTDEQTLFGDIETGMQVFQDILAGEQLTPESEQLLIQAVIAHQTVYLSNLRLVVNIAKHHTGFSLSLLDLIQAGNNGLSQTISRFDIHKGYKFSTYASFWIKQHITRAIGDDARTIRIPVHLHQEWIQLRKQITELELELGRTATEQEVASASSKSIKQVANLLQVGSIVLPSLNAKIDEDGTELGDLLADKLGATEPDQALDKMTMKLDVANILCESGLSQKEKFILGLRFGLDLVELRGLMVDNVMYSSVATYDYPRTLEEIGVIFGLGRERIRQIETKAMDKVRARVYSGKIA